VRLGQRHGHALRQCPCAHSDDVQRLVRTKSITRLDCLAIEYHKRLQSQQRVEIAYFPRAHGLAPMSDRDRRRGRRRSTLVEIRWKKIKAIGFEAEFRISDAAFANQYDLLTSAERGDDRCPFLERSVIRNLDH